MTLASDQPTGPNFVALQVRDVDAVCERLRTGGTTIAGEPEDSPFGMTFALVDPDGHRVVMHDD